MHQCVAAAGLGDAITNFAFELQSILRAEGFQSEIFAPLDYVPSEYRNTRIRPLSALTHFTNSISENDPENNLVIYHYSTGSPVTSVYANAKCQKWISYHNITPEKYFRPFLPDQADRLREGRESLKTLVSVTELALGDSEYNRRELMDLGFQKTDVLPLIISADYLRSKPNPSILTQYKDGKTNILFVGRIAPNKRFEDLIKTFYYYHHILNKNSRLILAGSPNGCEPYFAYLKMLVIDAGLSESVVFTGRVLLSDLIAYYQSATAFLCLSQHEGFCLPLLEAMHFGIPVFALAESAIPETLGGAGVLIRENDFKKIAELLNEILKKQDLLKEILSKQHQRLLTFEKSLLCKKLLRLIYDR